MPHPRDLSSRRYLELRDGIFEEIGLAHQVLDRQIIDINGKRVVREAMVHAGLINA